MNDKNGKALKVGDVVVVRCVVVAVNPDVGGVGVTVETREPLPPGHKVHILLNSRQVERQ